MGLRNQAEEKLKRDPRDRKGKCQYIADTFNFYSEGNGRCLAR